MVQPRKHLILICNVDIIVNKINKFVQYYAKEKNLETFIYTTYYEFLYQVDIFPDNSPVYKSILAEIYQINYEQMFYNANLDYVYNNSPFIIQKPTMRNVIESFCKLYHEEYLQIEQFINKMLYSFPTKLVEDDFQNINKLYNKIKNPENFSAKYKLDDI
jgi:hypothetical protein